MLDDTSLTLTAADAALRAFLDTHATPLRHALSLLKGRDGERLHDRLTDALQRGPASGRAARSALGAVSDVVHLRHLEDASPEDEARFAMIDPASSVVEEICLMADGFEHLVAALGVAVERRAA